MLTKHFTIKNKMGLHMRPADILVKAMTQYKSDITIIFNSKKIDGKSIMNIMASCIKCGSEIEVQFDGEDEEAMLCAFEQLVENGFGEE